MAEKLILGLGEVLWDCFPEEERPGGAPANFAYHATQLGFRGAVLSRVGQDQRGQRLIDWLQKKGLVTEWVQQDPIHPTGTVDVDVSRPDHPRFTIHENVAWDFMEATEAWRAAVAQAVAVCFGTLAQRSETSRQTIGELLRSQRTQRLIVYDVNLRQNFYSRAIIEASLSLATLVKLNDEEAKILRHLLTIPGEKEEDFCRALIDRFGVEAVCITRGANGCLLVDGKEQVNSPGIKVQVADTVGAGDAFTAAWIAARLNGWNVQQQAEFANRVGALVASLPGAMPSVRDEYHRLLAVFSPGGEEIA